MSKAISSQYTNASKVVGIQFGILSPEEIRNGSVAEITSKDTYVNNKPVIGGIFDPRMGVGEPGMICPTDGLDYMQSPGYFGHLELARPVFYIQFLSTVVKVLRCVCFKCSKILISKEKYKQALNMTNEMRWKYVFAIASKVKRCGEDIDDGCGCLQATKLKKEDLATIIMEWTGANKETINVKVTPEMVVKIFKRISDEDVHFLGFSPIWSRPEWMVCQVLAIPPPAIRPSVKMDHQQRSEDDLSHILISIIKTNKILQEKIANKSPTNVIDDWCSVLQYYIATQIDNKIPGVLATAQRSGRPLKSIKDRLNGKGGRMRSNLMAKRVDYSARSVITADPNISIRELGIPMKIAKNITKPVVVNAMNKKYLMKLVLNGPDVYPGAKIWEKKNGETITLRYVDRNSIVLEHGDIVHRHMLNGDPVLFNRQPTLHRMSMMCHIAKIMNQGDTFRMNVADTKPYNADFDGDEMNLHMPQDIECDSELRNLAAVPYQIISPSSNSPIIGIYQDSMVGAYLFTREARTFTKRDAMNLLMSFDKVDLKGLLHKKETISNFELITQILPSITLKLKNSSYSDSSTENNAIKIINGDYRGGQMDKGILNGSKGLINRICNDFGNMASSDFIDNLQNIVTTFLKSESFSVGISDLISDNQTNQDISRVIMEKNDSVKALIEETQLGIFDNTTGKSNLDEFEAKVNNILNQATAETSKIGLKSLHPSNRFVTMFKAGSKGSELNISQMISCVGQQNVNGKRIPYGFEDRTLPHFSKFDDTPKARGFVESSYINGLTPSELFFHAMGGRVGLIDTAVKTSTTGYIQRRLVKGLEDLVVNYDMSVRSNKNKIIQFLYGDDGIDPIRVENQPLKLLEMTTDEIYSHFNFPKDAVESASSIFVEDTRKQIKKEWEKTLEKHMGITQEMITARGIITTHVFNSKKDDIIRCPVAFSHIINNIAGQQGLSSESMVDISPLEVYTLCENTMNNLKKMHYNSPSILFQILFSFFLSPKELLYVRRFNRSSILILLETIVLQYKRAIVAPGEMVGLISAQSIGEPVTQMTLNTFHFAGVSSKSNVTRGVPRLEEILSLSSEPKNPLLSIYLKPDDETNKEKATKIMHMIEHTKLEDIVKSKSICFDPYDNMDTLIPEDKEMLERYSMFENMVAECANQTLEEEEKSKWVIRIVMDADAMLEKNITMDDINFTLSSIYGDEISCIFSDYNSNNLVFRIRLSTIIKSASGKTQKKKVMTLDQTDHIFLLKNFQDNLLKNVVLRGVKGIKKIIMRKIKDNLVFSGSTFEKKEIWVLDGVGNNLLEVLGLEFIDKTRTISNNIMSIFDIFGIEAARQAIYNELSEVIEFDGTYINFHHLSILIDRMTHNYKLVSIFRHGINNDNIGPIAKASFEETPEIFLRAAKHGELDIMRGVSANVMCGQEGLYGTNAFQVVLDMEKMRSMEAVVVENEDVEREIEEMGFAEKDGCSYSNINIDNNIDNIKYIPQKSTNYEADF